MQVFISYYVRRWRKWRRPDPERFSSPLVVLLCARNEAQVLPNTLPTLLRQTLPIQIVAGDDGSTDETKSILERALAGASHEVLSIPAHYHESFPGKQAVLTYLEGYVHPPYFGVSDADMWMPPTWAEALVGVLEANPHIGAVSGPSLPQANGLWSGFQRIEWASTLYLICAEQERGNTPPTAIGNSLWVRYEAWKSIGGWKGLSPTLVEDYHFMRALVAKGWQFAWVFAPQAYAETRPEKSLRGWWHQRLRWRQAVQNTPLLAKFYWSIQVLVPWIVLLSGWVAFGVWVLAEILPLWRLRQALKVQGLLRYTPLLLLYRYAQGMLFIMLSFGRYTLYWRGRRYIGGPLYRGKDEPARQG